MHKEKTQRQLRINKRTQQVLAKAFSKSNFEVNGKEIFLTITKADISPDFRNLSIFVSFSEVPENERKLIIKELNKSESLKQIRKILAKGLDLRITPNPIFVLDKSQEAKSRVFKIIEEEAKKFKKIDGN